MTKKYMKRCSPSLTIREMQTTTKTICVLTPLSFYSKRQRGKCWLMWMRRKGNPSDCKLVQSLWNTVYRFLKKLKRKLPDDPTTPLLVICNGRKWNHYIKELSVPLCSLRHYAQ